MARYRIQCPLSRGLPFSLLLLLAPAAGRAESPAAASPGEGREDAGRGDAGREGEFSSEGTHAPVPPASGFEAALAVGFGLPFGNADGGAYLFDTGGQAPNSGLQIRDGEMAGIATYRVPLALDLGYRLSPSWWIGLRPEAGTGGFGDECPTQASCKWTDARFGALAKWHLDPHSHSDPWLGLNIGWEWLRSSASFLLPPEVTGLSSAQAVTAKQTISGPLVSVLGGLAFDFGAQIHAGPFVEAAVGRYLRSSFDCPSAALGCPNPSWIDGGAFHAWLSVGASVSYGP